MAFPVIGQTFTHKNSKIKHNITMLRRYFIYGNLGIFMEVEYCTNEDVDVKLIKKEIQNFIDSLELNVSEELNMGKPEMYMKKHNIHID